MPAANLEGVTLNPGVGGQVAATDTVPGGSGAVSAQVVKALLGGDGENRGFPAPGAGSPTRDEWASGEVLPDQVGANGVLTFTFSDVVQFVEVHCVGGEGRADIYGGTPTASRGIRCGDDIPRPLYPPTGTTSVKVFAASGVTVTVHGARYGAW